MAVTDIGRVVAVGAVVEQQAPRDQPGPGGAARLLAPDGPDRLALTATLFAETDTGNRLSCEHPKMSMGMHRRGSAAIWKAYLGPPPLPSGPEAIERSLAAYRLRRQDVADAVNQLLGRDSEQHRPPRLSWDPLIELLSDHAVTLTEAELIVMPFRLEFAPNVAEQLDQTPGADHISI